MPSQQIVVVTPVYNDWKSLNLLIRKLDEVFVRLEVKAAIVAVDDGSTLTPDEPLPGKGALSAINRVLVLRLARNLGHQKSISIGLAYASEHLPCGGIVVMDCDGEDRPEDIPLLLEAVRSAPGKIFFARRAQRSESPVFRVFYQAYKILFRLLTGRHISFGNFSLIPEPLLKRVVFLPEISSHYAAGVLRAGLPWASVPTSRGKRFLGQSKMNFVALIIHGLSAIAVYNEILTVRLMLATVLVILLTLLGLGVSLYFKYFTPLAIPGWTTTVAIGVMVITFQAILFITLLSFLTLNYRQSKAFVPIKDYSDYVLAVEEPA